MWRSWCEKIRWGRLILQVRLVGNIRKASFAAFLHVHSPVCTRRSEPRPSVEVVPVLVQHPHRLVSLSSVYFVT